MDLGILRGLLTAILLILFIGIVFWAYSGKRKRTFDEAARLPLEDSAGDLRNNDIGDLTEGDRTS